VPLLHSVNDIRNGRVLKS